MNFAIFDCYYKNFDVIGNLTWNLKVESGTWTCHLCQLCYPFTGGGRGLSCCYFVCAADAQSVIATAKFLHFISVTFFVIVNRFLPTCSSRDCVESYFLLTTPGSNFSIAASRLNARVRLSSHSCRHCSVYVACTSQQLDDIHNLVFPQ